MQIQVIYNLKYLSYKFLEYFFESETLYSMTMIRIMNNILTVCFSLQFMCKTKFFRCLHFITIDMVI